MLKAQIQLSVKVWQMSHILWELEICSNDIWLVLTCIMAVFYARNLGAPGSWNTDSVCYPIGFRNWPVCKTAAPCRIFVQNKSTQCDFLVITFKRYNLNTGQVEHSKSTEGTVKRFPFLLKPHLLSTHFGLVDNWLIAMRGKGKCLTLDLWNPNSKYFMLKRKCHSYF